MFLVQQYEDFRRRRLLGDLKSAESLEHVSSDRTSPETVIASRHYECCTIVNLSKLIWKSHELLACFNAFTATPESPEISVDLETKVER